MKYKILFVGIFLIALISIAQAQYQQNDFSSNTQYFQPSYQSAYSTLGGYYGSDLVDYNQFFTAGTDITQKCEARQDFILNVRPGSCMPMVVRSDLLEEQNVPVFCKIDALKLNPLIEVASVKSIGFKGSYPKGIAGISWHPSQAALKLSNPVLESPLINDVGYVVVILQKTQAERDMPESISINMTAVLKYDMTNLFGSGKPVYFLPVMSDLEWGNSFKEFSFWKGKGYARVDSIEGDSATISIYSDKEHVIKKVSLKKGETSSIIYMPFSYCSVGILVNLQDVTTEKPRARIQIDDEETWVVQGQQILDGACTIKEINADYGGIGSVKLNCRGKNYLLEVGNLKSLSFVKDDKIEEVSLGEEVGEGIYLADIGHTTYGYENKLFAVLVKNVDNKSISSGKIIDSMLERIKENFEKWRAEAISKNENIDWRDYVKEKIAANLNNGKENVSIVFVGEEAWGYSFSEAENLKEIKYEGENKKIEDYFQETKKSSDELIELFAGEKEIDGNGDKTKDVYFGAESLNELAGLAENLKKQETEKSILRNLIDKYPDTTLAENAADKIKELGSYDYENAEGFVKIGDYDYYFRLLEVKKPGILDASAEFESGKEGQRVFQEGDYIISNNEEYVKLLELDDSFVKVEYNRKAASNENAKIEIKTLQVGSSLNIGFGNEILTTILRKINVKKTAQVQLISKSDRGTSEANLSVTIGIEKRAIKLSPEKTLERINNLNASIKKFENIVSKLGEVVKTMKATCLAGTLLIMAKNFAESLTGESTARKIVMDNHWKKVCRDEVGVEGSQADIDACYMKHSSEIATSVKEVQDLIKQNNDKMSELSKDSEKTSFFGLYKQVDSDKFREQVVVEFSNFVKNNPNLVYDDSGKTLGQVFGTDSASINSVVKDSSLGVTEMRNIMVYGKLAGSSNEFSKDIALSGLGQNVLPFASQLSQLQYKETFSPALQASGLGIGDINSVESKDRTSKAVKTVILKNNQVQGVAEGKYFLIQVPFTETLKQESLLLVPATSQGDSLKVGSSQDTMAYVVTQSGSSLQVSSILNADKFSSLTKELKIGKFVEINSGNCENRYTNAEVKYYETEPSKGLPAVVPLDLKRGWYAATKQILPGMGIQAYKQSGAVSSLWICNVGKNGKEEWQSSVNDDDPCMQVNYDTGAPLTQNPCLDEAEAKRLALGAKKLVESAASQYGKSGKARLSLLDGSTLELAKKSASKVSEIECQEFMSPEECTTIFNLCDPVLCPESRCDFGGTYPVDDVVQTGIIGSILLCLPNFGNPLEGGVVIPVCLTGIHAGLDAYTKMLKDHRDCLQANLDSGKMIGICDEIYSIYACEFFWRQAAPLAQEIVPRIFELITTGGQTRGGGEYLTVQNAFDNNEKSVNYFTNYYGVNAFKSFQARSTENVGTEVCKGFPSLNLPTDISGFIEPQSPYQFQAWFDEIKINDAVLAGVSQYKVYYHIYSGNDQGHYYQVYLKDSPNTGLYSEAPQAMVDSGYVSKGQTVDLTRDFTAASGYKQLCVRIDAKEECGFKQVGTSFALDYVKDKYMEEQASSQVTSELECVSGTPSIYAFAQPNLQEGAAEFLAPATGQGGIYQRGIIRVCSSQNPGEATNPERWKKVGYCGKESIGCWIDSQSVENAIKEQGIEDSTLEQIDAINYEKLFKSGEKWDSEQSRSVLADLSTKIEQFLFSDLKQADVPSNPLQVATQDNELGNLLANVNTAYQMSYFNSQRANALYKRFLIFKLITEAISKDTRTFVPGAGSSGTSSTAIVL